MLQAHGAGLRLDKYARFAFVLSGTGVAAEFNAQCRELSPCAAGCNRDYDYRSSGFTHCRVGVFLLSATPAA
jgi:hypothetical protein